MSGLYHYWFVKEFIHKGLRAELEQTPLSFRTAETAGLRQGELSFRRSQTSVLLQANKGTQFVTPDVPSPALKIRTDSEILLFWKRHCINF